MKNALRLIEKNGYRIKATSDSVRVAHSRKGLIAVSIILLVVCSLLVLFIVGSEGFLARAYGVLIFGILAVIPIRIILDFLFFAVTWNHHGVEIRTTQHPSWFRTINVTYEDIERYSVENGRPRGGGNQGNKLTISVAASSKRIPLFSLTYENPQEQADIEDAFRELSGTEPQFFDV